MHAVHNTAASTRGVAAPCGRRVTTFRSGSGSSVAARSSVLDRPRTGGGAGSGDGYDVSKRGGFDGDRDGGVLTLPRPETGAGGGSTDRSKGAPPGGGNHRLLLLDSAAHTEKRVVVALTQIVGVDESHARNCYATARSLGMALVVSVLKERAEAYKFGLYQAGVKAAIEPDTTTLA